MLCGDAARCGGRPRGKQGAARRRSRAPLTRHGSAWPRRCRGARSPAALEGDRPLPAPVTLSVGGARAAPGDAPAQARAGRPGSRCHLPSCGGRGRRRCGRRTALQDARHAGLRSDARWRAAGRALQAPRPRGYEGAKPRAEGDVGDEVAARADSVRSKIVPIAVRDHLSGTDRRSPEIPSCNPATLPGAVEQPNCSVRVERVEPWAHLTTTLTGDREQRYLVAVDFGDPCRRDAPHTREARRSPPLLDLGTASGPSIASGTGRIGSSWRRYAGHRAWHRQLVGGDLPASTSLKRPCWSSDSLWPAGSTAGGGVSEAGHLFLPRASAPGEGERRCRLWGFSACCVL
jgi:hypothetical protein